MRSLLVGLITSTFIVALVAAQSRSQAQPNTAKGDWITYGGDLGGTKYTELSDISPANVGTLKQAWKHQLTNPAGAG